jgi:beta-lactamase regulating signal transducer with metallopeptidase domain
MSVSALQFLAESTVATTFSILLIALIREPLRRVAGARVAYWVWLLVPASTFVALLPAPSRSQPVIVDALPSIMTSALPVVVSFVNGSDRGNLYESVGLAVWFLGAVSMFVFLIIRHRTFVRSLGRLTLMPDGTYRSSTAGGPTLVGWWNARIILPDAFETTYDSHERALVIAHELAHQRHLDIPLNALAAIWLCFFWFNPLAHWAVARFRSDQELACDAAVLGQSGAKRRRYGDALLKAQLVADSIPSAPIGCQWHSGHPLKERIIMIGRPLPSRLRRVSGAIATFTLVFAGSFVVWATHVQTSYAQAPSITWPWPAPRGEGHSLIKAGHMQVRCGGETDFSEGVMLTFAGPFSRLEVTAKSFARSDDGSILLEGEVRIAFGGGSSPPTVLGPASGGLLTTDRAVVQEAEDESGTLTRITMDTARLSGQVFSADLTPMLPCECDARCRVIGVD